jgi:hypothetical protein
MDPTIRMHRIRSRIELGTCEHVLGKTKKKKKKAISFFLEKKLSSNLIEINNAEEGEKEISLKCHFQRISRI